MKFFDVRKKVLFLLVLMGGNIAVFGQQTEIDKILGISVSGNRVSDVSVVKLSSGLKEGQDVTWEDIQRAVRQLWVLGIFSDIRILLDRKIREGIFITIKVEEYPRLDKMVVDGNKKFKTEDIEKEVGFFRGQVLNTNQISKAKRRLINMYAEKGYTLSKVETKLYESEKEGRAVLNITIDEGEKVQIKQIRFFGNNAFEDGKLRKQMKKTKEDRWWRGADFDREKYEEDKENVLAFYRNHGYRDTEISKDSLYYDVGGKDMFIDIWVREGRCYTVGEVTWEGNTLFSEKFLTSLLEFEEGDAFSQEKFDKSIQEKVGGVYYDLGYLFAQINPREVCRSGDTLDIHFVIDEGNPVRVRRIEIAGNTRTKERVIRRELRIRPGEVFSKELLMRSHRELMMLNYFSSVIPNVVPFNEEQMDLSFEVEEKSTDTANLSAGWSELDKLIGNVGLGMNNLFGNGQRLALDWNFGRYYRALNLSFTEPWFLSTPTLIGVTFYDTKRDPFYIGYRQRSRGVSFRVGRRFSWPDNFFRGDWIYRLDETELSDFNEFYQELNPNNIVNEDWPLISSGFTQIISRNSLDHPEFPTRGSRVSLSTEIAGGPMGGNVGYHKHIFSAEFFTPTFLPSFILLSRIQFGFMNILSKSGRIPYLEYFFMGGSGLSRAIPLRGYDDPLAGGRYTQAGGKRMLQTTLEIRFPIITNPMLFGLIFAEAGRTWTEERVVTPAGWWDFDTTDPFDLRRSVGIGARMFMPMVGMIGFDYAYGFDHEDPYGRRYGTWKPHFVFGRSF